MAASLLTKETIMPQSKALIVTELAQFMRCSASRTLTRSLVIPWSGRAGEGTPPKTSWPSSRLGQWRATIGPPPALKFDLVIELPGRHGISAIDVKRGSAAGVERGFHIAREDIRPKRTFVV